MDCGQPDLPVDKRFDAPPRLASLIVMSSRQDLAHRVSQNTNDIEALYDLSKDTNKRVTEIQEQHGAKLDAMQQTLDQHSQTLDSHGQKLDEVLGLLRDRP